MSWVDEGRKFGVIGNVEGQFHVLDTNMFGSPTVCRGSLLLVANLAMTDTNGHAVWNHYVSKHSAERFLKGESQSLHWYRSCNNEWIEPHNRDSHYTLRQFIALDPTEPKGSKGMEGANWIGDRGIC